MSSPWSTIVVPETKDLHDIILEELKENLRRKNVAEYVPTCPTVKWKYEMTDEELVKVLHEEYDPCYANDVCDSGDCENCDISCNSEEEEDPSDKIYYEKFDSILEKFDPIPLYNCKYRHDMDSKESKRVIFGVDAKAELILNDMIDNKIFDSVDTFVVKKKDVAVLLVKKYLKPPDTSAVQYYTVKVFKLRASKQLKGSWVKGNSETIPKPINMKQICEEAQKEAIYLQRLKKAGVPCSEVIALKQHVIVLSLIGERKTAPALKHINFPGYKLVYQQVIEYMRKMYQECNLIHLNLREGNILWYNNCCHFVNLSKAIEPHEENAMQLLFDECTNLSKFFTKMGVPYVHSPNMFFLNVTGSSGWNFFNSVSARQKKI
ncbi:hypothetical protein Trydic_g13619 [Trypoxylus dichotomus]